jgi:hypothetical protein
MDIEKSLVLVATNLKDYSDQQKAQLQSKIDEAFADIELVRALASKTSEKLLSAEEIKSALLEDTSFISSVVGEKGDVGPAGQDGKSVTVEEAMASLIADQEFLEAVKGPQGPAGEQGIPGEKGLDGAPGVDGKDGEAVSAEELIAVLKANEEFLQAVKGDKGDQGPQGEVGSQGLQGERGDSVTVEEVTKALLENETFTKSLVGEQGLQGEVGPQGEKGDNGNSVSVDEVKSALILDVEFVKSLIGPQGETGPSGSAGPQGEQGPQGEVGPEGLSIKAFEITETGELTIEMSDGQTVDLGMIKGADGRDGADFDVDLFYDKFKSDSELIESLKVDPTEIQKTIQEFLAETAEAVNTQVSMAIEAADSEFQEKMASVDSYMETFQSELEFSKTKSIEAGLQVAQEVADTTSAIFTEKLSEIDQFIDSVQNKSIRLDEAIENVNRSKVQQWTPDTVIKAGSWVEHDGRYYVANRDSDSIPGASTAYSLVLRGFEFRKAWNADTTYDRLDVVISSSGSAWIANKSEPSGEPGTTPDWNLLVKRGERGAKGDMGPTGLQGEKGLDAAEILDAHYDYESEEITFVKSDGSRVSFDLPVISMIQDMVTKQWLTQYDTYELPINDFKGLWNSNRGYTRGDVVSYSYGLYVAKTDSNGIAPQEFLSANAVVASGEAWQLMITAVGGGVGGGGGEGSVGPQGPAGPRGPIGPKGDTGPAGPTGPQGPAGTNGKDGAVGPAGPQGPIGETGVQGPAGADGAEGPAGATGPQGPAGMGINLKGHVPTVADLPTGATQGDTYVVDQDGNAYTWSETDAQYIDIGQIVGPQGETGPQGSQGIQGEVGPKGDTGAEGPQGPKGDTGPAGADGVAGPKGDTGAAGADGVAGPKGDTGDVGPQGPEGVQGIPGLQGPAGADGKDGAEGPMGPKGDLGPQGDVGAKGDIGNTGPQGEVGPVGPAGADGEVGPAGPQGEVGPKGDQGDQGIPGLGITFKGRVATVGDLPATATQGDMYIIDSTGDAWVWDDGAAAFENAGPIVGPTGPQGEAGAAGATGPEGPQGPAGPTAVSADADNTATLGTDGFLYVGKPTGYLPTSGGDMTGPINVKGDGAVAFMMDNGFNFQAVLQSTALRYGTKSVLGFNEDYVAATVPLRILTAPTLDEHAASKKYVDDKVAAGGGASGAYLPLAGGTLTGPITMPVGTVMNFTNTYSLFTGNGGVSFRFGATDLLAASSTGIYAYKPLITPATGIGIQFGNGGGYMSKVGNGIGVYTGGSQKFKFDSTEHTSLVPVVLPADPTTALQAATKQYVDSKGGATIVSVADGATEPAAADYPEGALLVRYTP